MTERQDEKEEDADVVVDDARSSHARRVVQKNVKKVL